MDYIRSAAGSELSDQSFRAVSNKPNWLLTPLPFAQLRPDYEPQHTSAVKSLASCALATISLQFDKYSLDSFATVPPHLIRRVISRVRADRNYDDDLFGQVNTHPDETTIWAIQAIYLPSEADDHILGLPCNQVLHHMPGHPVTLLPTIALDISKDLGGLSSITTFQFLTTISLDVSDEQIDDRSIQSLRWCTHLTGLWMQGCSVSDYGITLLASALELPGLKGMCRLRAWSLIRCKGITDKSMRAFAKFPGLIMLDLRDTSCTDVAIDIFNRQSASLFPHPGFQPCTDGLLDLFSPQKSPSEILSYLCSTLMKTTDYTALHIVPTTARISPQYTPYPDVPTQAPKYSVGGPTYRADGVGMLYGQGVSRIANPVAELRQAVKNLPTAWRIEDDEAKGIVRKRPKSDWGRYDWREDKKPKPIIFDPGKQKRQEQNHVVEMKGDPRLMMVRMIKDGWEDLTWGTQVRSSAGTAVPQTQSSPASSQIRSARPGRLMSDIMSTAKSTPSGPFRPTQSSSPRSSPPPDRRATSKTTRPSLNPFRIPSTNAQDVKPLVARYKPPALVEETFTSSQPQNRFGGGGMEDKKRSKMKMFTTGVKKI